MEERIGSRTETAKSGVNKKMPLWPLYWELQSEAASRKKSTRYVDYDTFRVIFNLNTFWEMLDSIATLFFGLKSWKAWKVALWRNRET